MSRDGYLPPGVTQAQIDRAHEAGLEPCEHGRDPDDCEQCEVEQDCPFCGTLVHPDGACEWCKDDAPEWKSRRHR